MNELLETIAEFLNGNHLRSNITNQNLDELQRMLVVLNRAIHDEQARRGLPCSLDVLTEFKLKPIDNTPLHDALCKALAEFLFDFSKLTKKLQGPMCTVMSIKLICLVADVLEKHGFKIVKM